MKIIDLLNKIAKGEEAPKKIKFENYIYKWRNTQKDYFCKQINHSLESIIGEYLFSNLNLDVEIIEEDAFEDIEETDVALLGQCDNWLRCPTNNVTKQDIELNPYIISNIRENTLEFQHKINDLIRNQKKIISKLEGKE